MQNPFQPMSPERAAIRNLALEIATALHAPLDIMVVTKLGAPYQPELALDAIASGDVHDRAEPAAAGLGPGFCFLYTNLANATLNAIYQRLGYEPVCDVVDYTFGEPSP